MHYIFDIDGTLTPSRQRMDRDFKEWFIEFAKNNRVYFATGSDKSASVEQLGSDLYNLAVRSYNCNGNEVWEGDDLIHAEPMGCLDELDKDLDRILSESKFHIKKGGHIEKRPGMVNFTIPGRPTTLEERFLYKQWDEHKNEREEMVEFLSKKYQGLTVSVAGETGIDIMWRGKDKSQIIQDFDPKLVTFYGDKMQPEGNDYTLSLAVARGGGTVHQVKSWEDTWKILKQLSE